jgi:hypothetical protein
LRDLLEILSLEELDALLATEQDVGDQGAARRHEETYDHGDDGHTERNMSVPGPRLPGVSHREVHRRLTV